MSTHIAICKRYLLKCDSWCAVIKYVSLSLFQAYSKVPDLNGLLSLVVSPSAIHQANQEVINVIDTFVPHVHIVYLFYLRHMLVSAAAHAPANCALSKTSPGMVSFFVYRLYANFSSTKITSLTRINIKKQK